jgi:hypothetical protein
MELAHGLSLKTTDSLSRFQWIKRFLANELVMLALRVGKRAIPICWWVYKTKGSLGWREQR